MHDTSAESISAKRIIPESKKSAYYPALDGIRTLAVAMVFLTHYIARVFTWGWIGVQLFFVLSGFLITGILADTVHVAHRFKNFYVRRALRIFPLYYGLLLLWTVIALLTHGTFPPFFWLWWVYLQNFFYALAGASPNDHIAAGSGQVIAAIGHLWTLAIEEQFYFLWPLIVFAVKDRRRLMQLCCLGIVLRIALAAWWQTHLSPAALAVAVPYRMLPTQCDGFLMGGFLALWLRGKPSPRVLARSGQFAAIAILLYCGVLLILHRVPRLILGQDVFDFSSGFETVLGIPLANLASIFLILATLRPTTWAYRLFHLAPMRSLGRISYGLYFYHLPIYAACGAAVLSLHTRLGLPGKENLWRSLIATMLTIVVSYASFYLFESRFLLLKNRFTSVQNPKEKVEASHSL